MYIQKIERASVAPRAQTLAGNVVLVWWDAPAGPQNGTLVATLGEETVARPFATVTVRTPWNGTRTVFVLRWPEVPSADSVLAIRDGDGRVLVEFPALPGNAIEDFTPRALLDGLDKAGRLRIVRLILELCPGIFRLRAHRGFVQNCRQLIGELVAEPSLLKADIRLTGRLLLCNGSAAQELGTRCVSVPIEARYNQIHGAPDFRPSHFRPLRDLWRITSHIVVQCLRRGGMREMHKRIRANPPVIDDPDGEFSPGVAPRLA